ncbi:MAG: DUF167 family protein [Xanthobacteraceae bacterium]
MPPWSAAPVGIMLTVRLTPKGGRDAIDGVETMADGNVVLKARVRAAPSEGEANAALTKLIAKALGVAPRAVELAAGATARIKRLKISGDSGALIAKLQEVSTHKNANAKSKSGVKV